MPQTSCQRTPEWTRPVFHCEVSREHGLCKSDTVNYIPCRLKENPFQPILEHMEHCFANATRQNPQAALPDPRAKRQPPSAPVRSGGGTQQGELWGISVTEWQPNILVLQNILGSITGSRASWVPWVPFVRLFYTHLPQGATKQTNTGSLVIYESHDLSNPFF